MTAINGYAAMQRGQALKAFNYSPDELGPMDVEVAITHCGICHSDLHLIDNDWKISSYPFIPGHEIIGMVTAAGGGVAHLKAGDRVGIGWQRGACLVCEQCASGNDHLCPEHEATCVGHHGGFAERIRVDSRYAFPVPSALASENAAPLLCGGATVYSPLRHHGVRPDQRVGVIGIGGLGHLALQFAAAMGCEVTAFSASPDKEKEAKSFGAHHFLSSREPLKERRGGGFLDLILTTVFVDLDWTAYLKTLRPNGTLCFLGAPPSPLSIPVAMLQSGQKSVGASVIGSRHTIAEMLEFAARHGITAKTEVLPLAEVNTALDKVRSNRARYRMVLEAGGPRAV